jgi:hypothetical protein
MGFMEGLQRFLQGKPVFEVPKNPMPQQGVPQQADAHPIPGENIIKVLPLVYVERVDSSNDTTHHELECELHIRNHSAIATRLERLEILGQHFELNKTYLQPGQEWEYIVRIASRPTATNFHEAKLFYESEDGNDFCAVHTIEYMQLPDRSYVIVRLHFVPPVRDI